MLKPSKEIKWIDYKKGITKIKTDYKGFAHVLVFDGKRVFPCVYNSWIDSFTCGGRYIQGTKKYAFMPSVVKEKKISKEERELDEYIESLPNYF